MILMAPTRQHKQGPVVRVKRWSQLVQKQVPKRQGQGGNGHFCEQIILQSVLLPQRLRYFY